MREVLHLPTLNNNSTISHLFHVKFGIKFTTDTLVQTATKFTLKASCKCIKFGKSTLSFVHLRFVLYQKRTLQFQYLGNSEMNCCVALCERIK